MKQITALELRDAGYLQEVNRQFFHPLGLAMFVNVDTGEMGVYDDRDDPEGWRFSTDPPGSDDLAEKAMNVRRLGDARRLARLARLGYWVQPFNGTEVVPGFLARPTDTTPETRP